jgi:signal peptidase I
MTRLQTLRAWNARRRLRRDAYVILKEARRIGRRYAHRLTPAQKETLAARAGALGLALRGRGDVAPPMDALLELLEGELSFTRKSAARQYAESIGGVVFVALLLRSFVVQAYQIPSGSMIPTLQVGDQIWVNKLVYGLRIPFTDIKLGTGYRPPRRGEIIVFSHPRDPDTDLIKRVVAVGGDEVEMRDDVVYVNGRATARTHDGARHYFDFDESDARWIERDGDAWQEQLGKAQFTTLYDPRVGPRSFAPVRVPDGELFVMGDNRDNSSDSRYWGFVPLNLVRGRAMVVWWSHGQPEGIRLARLGHVIE